MWIFLVLFLASPVFATCENNCVEFKGSCACDAPAEKAVQTFIPPDEKPRHEQQREWEVGLVHAEMPPSVAAMDARMDAERLEAENWGKNKAGLTNPAAKE